MELNIGSPIAGRLLIDKNPGFTYLIPPFVRTFPETKFIIALRDPRDVVLSCFMQPHQLNLVTASFMSLEGTAESYTADDEHLADAETVHTWKPRVFSTAIRQALKTANVQVTGINVTLGGCAFWHAVVQIKKGAAGDGKNALLAALSVMDLKHVVVIDDDIDINDPTDVEWAIATRVQGDKDIIIVPGARAKPLDPSLLQGAGVVPIGTKVGIDATIPKASRSSTTSASPTPTPTPRRWTTT